LRAGLRDQVVQAEALDQPQRFAATAFADRLHRHDRADAEHQPEQGQAGAQAPAPEFLNGLAPDRRQRGEQAVHGLSASVAFSSVESASASSPSPASAPGLSLPASSSLASSSGTAAVASSTWSPGDSPDS